MTNPKTPQGDFVAFINRDKKPGDNRPMFDGKLEIPGTEVKHAFALWAHAYVDPKTGEEKIMYNGSAEVSSGGEPQQQVRELMSAASEEEVSLANLSLKARQIVLFQNRFKEDAPEKKRPDYWGAFNPGNGQPIVRISVWNHKDRYQKDMLTGATSYPEPKKSELEQQDAALDLEQMVDAGELSRGMPAKAKKVAGGRSR